MTKLKSLMAVPVLMLLTSAIAMADSTFTGTLYYTTYNGGENVWKTDYSYNETTHAFSLTNNTGIAALSGADGIIFDANGNLLVGGQSSGKVFQGTGAVGPFIGVNDGASDSYHLALSPDGKSVYTSNFEGSLDILPVVAGTLTAGTTHTVTGGDTGVTQVAFAPNGKVFYVNGNPNGFGDIGTINLTTYVTTRLFTSVTPAHGLIYDDYTGLITMFGDGYTGTVDPTTNALKTSSTQFICDFDQGATDGHGHALVAGCGNVTLLDYHISGDITHPDFYTSTFVNSFIDDVAPLSGVGSQTPTVPEPSSLVLLCVGLVGLVRYRRFLTASR